MPAFDPDDHERDSAQHLNARIAGVLGAARIFAQAGDAQRRDEALNVLAKRVIERVRHEWSDHQRDPRGR